VRARLRLITWCLKDLKVQSEISTTLPKPEGQRSRILTVMITDQKIRDERILTVMLRDPKVLTVQSGEDRTRASPSCLLRDTQPSRALDNVPEAWDLEPVIIRKLVNLGIALGQR
jgi:hypothetical protein